MCSYSPGELMAPKAAVARRCCVLGNGRLCGIFRCMKVCFAACAALLILLLAGCYDLSGTIDRRSDDDDSDWGDDDAVGDDDTGSNDDLDGDGWQVPDDCDDQDPSVHPGANEICNDRDDDCDGLIDEEGGGEWFEDHDGDGFGVDSSGQVTCDPDAALVPVGGDCDDQDPSVYPGNTALVDGLDSDCDGARDWRVTIYVAVDDAGELCIDSWANILGDTGGWVNGTTYEYWMHSGVHTIGIKGWDLGQVITAAIAHVEISTGQMWVSDASWRYDPDPTASEKNRVGWCDPYFDDSGWDLVLDIGPIGTSPWGGAPSSFPGGSPAHWIWDHFPVNLNTQYLRKEFVLP